MRLFAEDDWSGYFDEHVTPVLIKTMTLEEIKEWKQKIKEVIDAANSK